MFWFRLQKSFRNRLAGIFLLQPTSMEGKHRENVWRSSQWTREEKTLGWHLFDRLTRHFSTEVDVCSLITPAELVSREMSNKSKRNPRKNWRHSREEKSIFISNWRAFKCFLKSNVCLAHVFLSTKALSTRTDKKKYPTNARNLKTFHFGKKCEWERRRKIKREMFEFNFVACRRVESFLLLRKKAKFARIIMPKIFLLHDTPLGLLSWTMEKLEVEKQFLPPSKTFKFS
jgi:hypothetical protein